MARIKKQSKFIKECNEIFYVDKYGKKWDKGCIDELFEAVTQRQKIEETLDYYSYKD